MSNLAMPFRKHNTVSLTNDISQARVYGKPYRVYPWDGTLYLYGRVDDMWDIGSYAAAAIYQQGVKAGWAPAQGPWGSNPNEQVAALSKHMQQVHQWCEQNAQRIWEKYSLSTTRDPAVAVAGAMGEILAYGKAYFAVAT